MYAGLIDELGLTPSGNIGKAVDQQQKAIKRDMSNLNNSPVPVNQIDQRRLSNVSTLSTTDLSEQNTPRRGNKREPEDDLDEEETGDEGKSEKRAGRRKIKIEYIEDKSRRHITFSKRKAGIMKKPLLCLLPSLVKYALNKNRKRTLRVYLYILEIYKAYELSTLTGTQVLLLVVSETGLVYTFTTPKLQPLVTKPEGKNLIQACLNAPDPPQEPSTPSRVSQNPPTYSNDNAPTVDGNNNDSVYDSVDRKQTNNNNNQMSSAQPYAIGLNPYVTNQYGGIPNNMAMNTGGGIPTTAASYMSSQYPQYAQQHMNQYAQNSTYMGSPTGANNYWNQAANTSATATTNTTSSPNNNGNNTKVQQYSSTMYTDDVYGISRFLKKLIKEARDEVLNVDNSDQDNGKDQSNSHPKTALERLKMVRARLLIDGRFNHAHIRDTSHLDFTDKWGYEKLPDDAIAVPLKHQPPSNDDNDDCK
ncbi:7485_t:CDS:2 [Entrophospora sp. SA101]|nr:7485_t:CDS:2 [Entrophospora sp. SA101]